jgi:MoaA/NifB/PqqE/SkfB family radical SAM enzyme
MSQTMSLKDKLYQEVVLKRIEKTDWKLGNSSPLVVELDPTSVCDLACPGCISEDIIALGNRFSDDRLMSLGQEFIDSGVNAVILIGGGEPLAHRKVGDLMTLLGKNDIHIGITTNGTLMDRYMDIISQYSSWTRVSVDAATDQTFSKLRPTKGQALSKFNKVIDNMTKLAIKKKGKLGFSFLIQTEADGIDIVSNVHEIYDAALLAREIGCDYFEVKPTYQFRDDVPHSLMKHDKSRMNEARDQIQKLDDLETNNFKILKAINLEASLRGVDTAQTKTYKSCPSTHLRTTVTPLGVYVCPYWRGKDYMKIGDANSFSFADIWHGQLRKDVMERLDASKDCQFHCLRNDTNNECISIKDKQLAGESLTIVEEFDRFI